MQRGTVQKNYIILIIINNYKKKKEIVSVWSWRLRDATLTGTEAKIPWKRGNFPGVFFLCTPSQATSTSTSPGVMEEDSQLWLDPLGWVGLAFPTWRSKEGEACARLGQLSTEGFGDTQGTSASSAGGRQRKYQENRIHPTQREGSSSSRGCRGLGGTFHTPCSV